MKIIAARRVLFAVVFCAALSAPANILLSVSGPETNNIGLGIAGPSGTQQQAAAVSFTTAAALNGVNFMILGTNDFPQTVTAELLDKIGPGAAAADVVVSGAFTSQLGDGIAETVLSNVNIGPGTYYLFLTTQGLENLSGWDLTDAKVVSAIPGLSYGTSYGWNETGGSAFPPSSPNYVDFESPSTGFPPQDLLFSIVTPTAVPEPGALLLFGTGLMAAVKAVSRKRGL